MNWITKNISEVINDFISGAMGFFDSTIIYVFDQNVEIFTSEEITSVELIIKSIAIVLVIAVVLKQIFSIYVTETDGDPDADPMQLIVKASISLALIEGNSLIFDVLQTLSRKLTIDIVGACEAKQFSVTLSTLIGSIANINLNTSMISLTCLISLIFLIVFLIKSGIRGGELIIARILLPIFAVDKISNNPERWNAFFTNYVVTFISYSFQLFLMRVGINRIIAAMLSGVDANFQNYFAGMVLFYLAIKTPKWLEKFIYSSGIGQMAGNTGRSLAYMIPSMIAKK